jgi:hypothetical protein
VSKQIRISLGALLVTAGIVFFIIPGSMLFVLLGLAILSCDLPHARSWLKTCQKSMSRSARKLDSFLLNRKLKR